MTKWCDAGTCELPFGHLGPHGQFDSPPTQRYCGGCDGTGRVTTLDEFETGACGQCRGTGRGTDRKPPDTDVHLYKSTACHHGLHERCRDTCKFCNAPCNCGCH